MDEAPCKLSVVVITLNEADRIERLIQSVTIADEIIIVDSGSTDGTVEHARSLGARVIHHEFSGYITQKNWALAQAKGEWILSLDADEALSQDLSREIEAALSSNEPELAGFSMPRLSYYLGRWIYHGGWYPDRKLRLIRRGRATWQGIDPHDILIATGKEEKLNHPILHRVYRNIADQIHTINKFSEISATRHGRKKGWYVTAGIFHAIIKFFECYVWKLGLLDGIPGLIIAVNSSFYVFLRHAKAWEMNLIRE